jgi:hypothetical protein
MTASTSSSSAPGTPGSAEPRHRSSGGRGYGRETETSGPIPPARREGGRHRAPDAPPSSGFRIVPGPREAEGETGRTDVPGGGFRPLPPSGPTTPSGPPPSAPTPPPSPGVSSIGVPLGAVPAQREPAVPRRRPDPDVAVPRRRPARTHLDAVPDDEAVTVPIRREALDRAAAHRPVDPGPPASGARGSAEPTGPGSTDVADPPLRPLTVQRPAPTTRPGPAPRPRGEAPDDVPSHPAGSHSSASRPAGSHSAGSRPAGSHSAGSLPAGSHSAGSLPAGSHSGASRPVASHPADPTRGVPPWETPPIDQASARLGLVAVALGLLGALVALAPWSGVLPRILPGSSLGITPVFNLVGALLGVVALGLGAAAMFRAVATSRGLLAGVVGACAGAAAIVVGLVV